MSSPPNRGNGPTAVTFAIEVAPDCSGAEASEQTPAYAGVRHWSEMDLASADHAIYFGDITPGDFS
jgi:hypothetical protein